MHVSYYILCLHCAGTDAHIACGPQFFVSRKCFSVAQNHDLRSIVSDAFRNTWDISALYFWTFQVFELQQLTKASKFPFSCRSQALCARHMQTPWFSITSDQSPECNKSFTSPVFIACLASTAPRNGQCAASLAESLCFAGNVPHTFCILCNDLPDAVSAHSCRSPQEMPCAPRDSSLPADSPAHCPRLHTCCSGQIPRECQDHRDKACNTCNRCRESWDIAP